MITDRAWRSDYRPEIDGLRALAALLVLAFHAGVPGFNAGFVGVDIFFVLSGYLITNLLVVEYRRNGRIDYWLFLVRRFRRLYPALIFFLLFYLLACNYYFGSYSAIGHVQDFLYSAFYLVDLKYYFDEKVRYLSHMWTLGVELKFYFFWPLIFIFMMRFAGCRSRVFVMFCAVYFFFSFWRISVVCAHDQFWLVYDRFDTRLTGLLLGGFFGFFAIQLNRVWGILGFLGLLIFLWLAEWKGYITAILGFSFSELFSAAIVCSNIKFLGFWILPWIGKMSYGFYLWHYLFIRIGREMQYEWVGLLLLGLVGGMSGAVLSYYTIERHFRVR